MYISISFGVINSSLSTIPDIRRINPPASDHQRWYDLLKISSGVAVTAAVTVLSRSQLGANRWTIICVGYEAKYREYRTRKFRFERLLNEVVLFFIDYGNTKFFFFLVVMIKRFIEEYWLTREYTQSVRIKMNEMGMNRQNSSSL